MVSNSNLPINHCIHHIHNEQHCRACDEATLTKLRGALKVIADNNIRSHFNRKDAMELSLIAYEALK